MDRGRMKRIHCLPHISTRLSYATMAVSRSQNHIGCDSPSIMRWAVLLLRFFMVLVSPAAWVTPESEAAPSISRAEPEEVFGTDTPLGRLSYRAGRGLRVGDTGLVIGGFTTAEVERLEGGDSRGGVDELSFLGSARATSDCVRSCDW
jgi:hypothetical protein